MSGGAGGIALGVLVGLLSTCIQSVGLTLQRKSHLLEEQKEEDYGYVRRPPYRRRRWQLGMLMFLISNIVGSTIQITTLPLPVLSTLQASGLVFNTVCATLLLSEPFTRYSLIGTLLVATGAVLIGAFGALTEPSHTLDQLLLLLGRYQFLVWLCSTFFLVGVVLVVAWLQERVNPRPSHRVRLALGMAYGSISGVLSAHCLLLAKSAVELLIRTIVDHHNQFNRWQSWMILLGLVFLALSQLYYLHRGLKLCSTSVLYPFVFCIYNIIAILDGLIYFHQTSRLPSWHAGLIAVGTVILLGGVFALSWRLDPDNNATLSTAVPADSKAVARVPPPSSTLAPGMGLIDTSSMTDSEQSPLRPGDDDESVSAHQRQQQRLSSKPSETTPLLRTRTTPLHRLLRQGTNTPGFLDSNNNKSNTTSPSTTNKKKRRAYSALRPSRPRRLTVAGESNRLWDELNNDADESRSFSDAAQAAAAAHAAISFSSPLSSSSSPSPVSRHAHRRSPLSLPGATVTVDRTPRPRPRQTSTLPLRAASGLTSPFGLLDRIPWRVWERGDAPPTPSPRSPLVRRSMEGAVGPVASGSGSGHKAAAAAAADDDDDDDDDDEDEDEDDGRGGGDDENDTDGTEGASEGRNVTHGMWPTWSPLEPRMRRRRSETNVPEAASGGWFKLRWWKRRWRDGDDEV